MVDDAGPPGDPLRDLQPEARPCGAFVEGDGVLRPRGEADGDVIAEIFADPRQGVAHDDANLAQMIGIADARELQKLRGIDGAARQDHLPPRLNGFVAAIAAIGDPRRAPPFKQNRGGVGARPHLQIGPLHGGAQEPLRCALPPAARDGALGIGGAELAVSVVVRVARDADALRRRQKGVA